QWLLRDWRRACMAIDEIAHRRSNKIADSHELAGLVAHVTRRIIPALGILIARGALVIGALFEGDVLLDEIEEARDYLEPPPDAPAQEASMRSVACARPRSTGVRASTRRDLSRRLSESSASTLPRCDGTPVHSSPSGGRSGLVSPAR